MEHLPHFDLTLDVFLLYVVLRKLKLNQSVFPRESLRTVISLEIMSFLLFIHLYIYIYSFFPHKEELQIP